MTRAAAGNGEQTDHVAPTRSSGRRSSKLRVVEPLQLPADFEMKPGVPRERSECANLPRPCPHLECRHHLWLQASADQPGNPQAGKRGGSTLSPASSSSCALDVAARGPQSFDAIGKLLGIDPTRARQIAMRAVLKLQAQGLNVDELLQAI